MKRRRLRLRVFEGVWKPGDKEEAGGRFMDMDGLGYEDKLCMAGRRYSIME